MAVSCRHPGNGKNKVSANNIENPVTANDITNSGNLPVFKFESQVFDFGMIIQGEKVSHTFKFTNTGKSDLVISSASASCGCTVPKYETKPVPPKGHGEIEVVFNSENREGMQHKTVTVLANTQPNRYELSFTANVVTPGK